MKTMRKVLSVLLVLAMVLSLGAMAVSAADPAPGSITVTNPYVGETYTLYKIFDLTYSPTGNLDKPNAAYTFTKTEKNTDFFNAINNGKTDEKVPFVLTATTTQDVYNVELKTGLTEDVARDKIKTFLKANERLLSTDIPPQTVKKANVPVQFTGLTYGYYYLTSTAGTEVIIKNNYENVEIAEKNIAPTVEKKVDGGTGSASVGDTIHFTVTITAQKGAKNYVLKDTLSEGLTLNEGSVKVYTAYTDENNNTPLAEENYQVYYKPASGASFEVSFAEAYLNGITAPTPLYVKYSAVLNEKAVVGTDPVTNKAVLDYGDKSTTESTPGSTTTTYTYGFPLRKIEKVNDVEKDLAGAKFKLYREVTVGDKKEKQEVHLYMDTDFYRPIMNGESASPAIVAGNVEIKGLAAGTYYLEETEAPAGYNKLTKQVKVVITPSEDGATRTIQMAMGSDQLAPVDEVKIENKAGTLLPSTGGMGTTMFYVLGAVLVLGAAILLVAKRRVREQ